MTNIMAVDAYFIPTCLSVSMYVLHPIKSVRNQANFDRVLYAPPLRTQLHSMRLRSHARYMSSLQYCTFNDKTKETNLCGWV